MTLTNALSSNNVAVPNTDAAVSAGTTEASSSSSSTDTAAAVPTSPTSTNTPADSSNQVTTTATSEQQVSQDSTTTSENESVPQEQLSQSQPQPQEQPLPTQPTEEQSLLDRYFSILDCPPPLNPLLASYWTKSLGMLMTKRPFETLRLIKSQPNILEKLLTHVGSSAIADFIMRLIYAEDLAGGTGTVQVGGFIIIFHAVYFIK